MRKLLPCLLSSLIMLAAPLATLAAPPPVAHFFENAAFDDAVLSPSGRYLAALVGGQGQRHRLAVVDLADNHATIVAAFDDVDVHRFQWVNDERLLFDTHDRNKGQRDQRYAPGLYAVNRDGKKFRQLAKRNAPFWKAADDQGELLPWHTYMLEQTGPKDGDYSYVYNTDYAYVGAGRNDKHDLLRLNTVTGRAQPVDSPADSQSWLLDQGGEPRLASTLDQGIRTIHYRDPASGAWRKLTSFDDYQGGASAFEPLAFGPDGSLYVVSNAGRDTSALYRYDLATGKLDGQALVTADGYDFNGRLIISNGKLVGVRVLTDGVSHVWFDPAMKATQQAVDALLPATVNLVTPPLRPASPWVQVVAYSDRQPARYLVYNTDSKRLQRVGDTAPDIRPAEMGASDLVHYKARDGLDIPAWLTLPPGSDGKNLPMVVLVHGGPFMRGKSWNWDAQAQFLATRGYAVLEPEFRGSTGFGQAHFHAGWKQWGLKMQDDVADGARWAIAGGVADPKRICIAGASYGGYATLMGLVNDPGLYQCGVEWAGVTDIKLMYNGSWGHGSDLSATWKQYGMPRLIGDQVQDADQLKATSPLQQAGRIKRPLLLAYGGADQRVPLEHGLKFLDAVKAGNPDVEWIAYPEEGHGWSLPKNRIDFWTRVEQFLARNIGPR